MKKIATTALPVTILAAILLLAGCGYHSVGSATGLPPEIKSIAVITFNNSSFEPGIEARLTEQVIARINRDGRLKVVPLEKADAILRANIISYSDSATSFSANLVVTSYQSSVSITFTLTDTHDLGIEINSEASANSAYSVSSSLASSEASRLSMLDTLGDTLGNSIITNLLGRF